MVYLAEHHGRELVQLKDVAKQEEIPFHFLAKTMQILARRGLVFSQRGPKGGFALALRPEQITLFDIADPIDHISNYDKICILGIDECSDQAVCPLHDDWKVIRHNIRTTLEQKNLSEMVGKLEEKRRRVAENDLK